MLAENSSTLYTYTQHSAISASTLKDCAEDKSVWIIHIQLPDPNNRYVLVAQADVQTIGQIQ